tara:strand:+ start:44 stop:817 length:774 start_codon:yes stop_codon:yes gene_type:complete
MKKILIFTLLLILSCSQAESILEREDSDSSTDSVSIASDNSLRNKSDELEILRKEIKLIQKEVGENRELIEKLLEQKVIPEKIESGELCDYGECKDNPLNGEVTITISDEESELKNLVRGKFDIENKAPYVKAGTKINYHYVGNTYMLYVDELNELIFIEPDEVIECIPLSWEEQKTCDAYHPSNYLALFAELGNYIESSGISAPLSTIALELIKCTEPDMCFVDWVNNQSLYKHPHIEEDFIEFNIKESFTPQIVD